MLRLTNVLEVTNSYMFILDWVNSHEPLWLFVFLLGGLLIELHSNYMLRKEFDYDKEKDDQKKQRRTKTTKKTTTEPSGASITEESTEISEPMQEGKK